MRWTSWTALVTLIAPSFIMSGPFEHPCLQVLHALALQCGVAWRGKTADSCRIQTLYIAKGIHHCTYLLDDDILRNMPMLPELRSFHRKLYYDERYEHLAALLGRQAGSLQDSAAYLFDDAFLECWHVEMPACTRLVLNGDKGAMQCLNRLGACRLPAVQHLQLRFARMEQPASADSIVSDHMAWLANLPALQSVNVRMGEAKRIAAMADRLRLLRPNMNVIV